MKKVKITGFKTCQIVADITKDASHRIPPVIMSGEQWNSIKGFVKIKREQAAKRDEDLINSIFKDWFQ